MPQNIHTTPENENKSSVNTAKQKNKKPLTTAQKRLRWNIRRYAILGGLGLCAIGLLVLLVFLITLPFRLIGNRSEESSVLENSAYEESIPSPSPSPEYVAKEVTLMAVGDNLIHSTVIEYGLQSDGTYDFTEIYSYMLEDIQGADIACIQQETIYISDPNQYTNYPAFGTPTEMASSLATVGFDVVCHASNHTLDKGTPGVTDTLTAWEKHSDVTVLGIHASQEDADTITVVEKNEIKISMLNYTYGLNGYVPEYEYMVDMLTEDNKERIQSQIQEAKLLSDIVIVFMHAGTEDSLEPDSTQISWAQFFADNGVGLVIGTHPHAIEPVDVVIGSEGNEMPIFYSLGNFISSQKDTVNLLGAMANVTITKDETGTYVSEYSMSPVVTWITGDGVNGTGYAFHTVHLEEYTEEMAQKHIRDNASPADFQAIWDQVTAMETESETTAEEESLFPAA